MAPLTPAQQLRRERIEGLIALAAPVLDAVLAVGDRISRLVGPDDDPLPIRPASERFELTRATPASPPIRASEPTD